jgi:hypothetical protein
LFYGGVSVSASVTVISAYPYRAGVLSNVCNSRTPPFSFVGTYYARIGQSVNESPHFLITFQEKLTIRAKNATVYSSYAHLASLILEIVHIMILGTSNEYCIRVFEYSCAIAQQKGKKGRIFCV